MAFRRVGESGLCEISRMEGEGFLVDMLHRLQKRVPGKMFKWMPRILFV